MEEIKELLRSCWHASGMRTISFTPYDMNYENKMFEEWYNKQGVKLDALKKYKVVPESRVGVQDWYETDTTKSGWDSHGWIFKDDRQPIDTSVWEISELLESDKYYNPIEAVFIKSEK